MVIALIQTDVHAKQIATRAIKYANRNFKGHLPVQLMLNEILRHPYFSQTSLASILYHSRLDRAIARPQIIGDNTQITCLQTTPFIHLFIRTRGSEWGLVFSVICL